MEQATYQKKVELYKLLKKKEAWVKAHRIYYYEPQDQQLPFYNSKAKIRMLCGSNRSGKTEGGITDALAFAFGFYPWLLPEELKYTPIDKLWAEKLIPLDCLTPRKGPQKVLILEDDWDIVEKILTHGSEGKPGKLKYYIPPEAISGRPLKNGQGFICGYEFKNGSTLTLDTEKSYDNNPGSFEGPDWDYILNDEPKKRALRNAVARGLVDRKGIEVFSFTPLAEPWMKDELWDKAAIDDDIDTFFLDAYKNPHIDQAGWKSYVESLTPEERLCREKGEWAAFQGVIFKEFKNRMAKDGGHVIEPPDMEWLYTNTTTYVAIDPHARNPQTVLFASVDKEGHIYFWHEIYKQCLIKELCKDIKAALQFYRKGTKKRLTIRPHIYIADPCIFNPNPIDDRTWADEFDANGIYCEPGSKDLAHGIADTREAFKNDKLYISKDCKRTIWEIQRYVWADFKDQDRTKKEKPKDKDDHMMECLRRIVVEDPQHYNSQRTQPIHLPDADGLCP